MHNETRICNMYPSALVNVGIRDSNRVVANPAKCPKCQTVHPFKEVLAECDFCNYNVIIERRMNRYEAN